MLRVLCESATGSELGISTLTLHYRRENYRHLIALGSGPGLGRAAI